MPNEITSDRASLARLRPPERDLRLDFLRGLGQWMVYLDHIPLNVAGYLTLRNYGFSDAAEFFVFISGYTTGFVYGAAMRAGQIVAAAKRLFRRVAQLYVAHILLFLFFTAQIARTALRFDTPMYQDEFNVARLLERPDLLIPQALLLKFKPVNLDVLPLYIVLLLAAPAILWGLVRRPNWTLAGSAVLYLLARHFDWNLPSYPGGKWYFNPFAWQLLFVFGAWCGQGAGPKFGPVMRSRAALVIALAWVCFAFLIVMTWHIPALEPLVPKWLGPLLYPIDKTNLDPLRLTHFLALLVLVVRYLPRDWPRLTSRWLRPIILCGQRSLPVFCLGVFLSFAAHWILVQIAAGVITQLLVSIAGLAILVLAAWLFTWYRNVPELFNVSARVKPERA